jgi:xanthine dehydrogenase accessory factor
VEGFVGGVCAESSVRLHALRAMETGEPLLLRLLPDAGDAGDAGDDPVAGDAVTEHNPCLSGGALEIFLDPVLPAPRVVVVGDAPVAVALRELAPHVGLDAVAPENGVVAIGGEDLAVVVASHGRDEEPALAAALTEGVAYVGLVASPRRGEAVRAALDVDDALRARLRTPAGLDIGARTPPEIALSILAEIVQERRSGAPRGTPVPGVGVEVPATAPGDGHCCHGHGG